MTSDEIDTMIDRLIDAAIARERAEPPYRACAETELSEARAAIKKSFSGDRDA